jgi:LemA protein
MTIKHWIGIGITAVLVLWAISVQRGLVEKEERVQEAWGFVQSQYERRADLIPNLVATVRGAADFERETLEAVVDARARATSVQLSADALNDPQAMENFQAAQNQLSGALSRLLVTVERYPELRANQNFRDLQTQLEGTENRIATERNRFNTAVREYNTSLRLFPGNILAGMLGFQQVSYFEATAGAERAPTVEF